MVRVNQSYNKEQKDEDSPIINTTLLPRLFLNVITSEFDCCPSY